MRVVKKNHFVIEHKLQQKVLFLLCTVMLEVYISRHGTLASKGLPW